MKILTWNVAHQTHKNNKNLSHMAEALASLSADILVLNEYVPGKYHQKFTEDLESYGYKIKISPPPESPDDRQNQILIASRISIENGTIHPPRITPAVYTNVLHVRIPDKHFDVIGLRVPDIRSKDKVSLHKTWQWITEIAHEIRDKPFIILGDLNNDTGTPEPDGGSRFDQLKDDGWLRAPASGYSFWSKKFKPVSRIDHALFTRHFTVKKAEYITHNQGVFFTKTCETNSSDAMSDHAVLLVEFDLID